MDGRSGMRAADADREATAERLRQALEEGRLSLHEYDERLGQAYGAKTYGELDSVLADLPGVAPAERSAVVPAATPPPPAAPATDGAETAVVAERGGGWLLGVWMPWLRVAGILTVIWLIGGLGSGHFVYYWPAWALGPWGVMLLLRTLGGHDGRVRREFAERRREERRERRARRRAR